MIDIKFHRSESGVFQVEVGTVYELLGIFLECDGIDNLTRCNEIIELVDAVKESRVAKAETVGNSCVVEIDKEKAHIETLFAEVTEICEISLNDFRQVLVDCKNFIENEKLS